MQPVSTPFAWAHLPAWQESQRDITLPVPPDTTAVLSHELA
jgi:hypothetical protein